VIRRLSRAREQDDGFTLIELLIVTMIIGILAAIAITVFVKQRGRGYDAAIRSDLRNAASAEEAYLTGNNLYSSQSPVGAELAGEGFRYSSAGDYTSSTAAITVALDGNNGYCLSATSSSGNVLMYDSENGGIQPVNGSCSF
jgi:type IV pilus assembly protein PilA